MNGKGRNKNKNMDLMNYEIISVMEEGIIFRDNGSKEDVLIEEQGVEKLPVRLGPAQTTQGKQMLDYSKNRVK